MAVLFCGNPLPREIVNGKEEEQHHVMGNHAGPRRDEAVS